MPMPKYAIADHFMSQVDYFDWTLHVVSVRGAIEYMVVDPSGKTLAFSANGYGNEARAMYEGLAHMFKLFDAQ